MRRAAVAFVFLLVASCQSSLTQGPAQPQQFVIFFRDGSATLSAEGREIVDHIAVAARKLHPAQIIITGQNDGLPPKRENMADQRAIVVAAALAKAGIDPSIIRRAGSEEPKGVGIAAHSVLVRLSPPAG